MFNNTFFKDIDHYRLATRKLRSKKKNKKKSKNPKNIQFYKSRSWRELRFKAFKRYGRKCLCCGASPEKNNIVLHVDHIKPRSKYPELELDIENLQILCEECNEGKSNYSNDDFRSR